MTVRQRCYRPDAAGGYCAPQWWLPCFDLSTEFHLFAAEYRKRATATGANIADSSVLPDSGSETNCWIIKPARGTRGIGHLIVTSSDEAGLQQIAQSCPMLQLEYEEGRIVGINAFRQRPMDRIAQLLVTRPLLVKKRKFDLRLFVFIRSFVPFEGKAHNCFTHILILELMVYILIFFAVSMAVIVLSCSVYARAVLRPTGKPGV